MDTIKPAEAEELMRGVSPPKPKDEICILKNCSHRIGKESENKCADDDCPHRKPATPNRMEKYIGYLCELRDIHGEWHIDILREVEDAHTYWCDKATGSNDESMYTSCRPHPQTVRLLAEEAEVKMVRAANKIYKIHDAELRAEVEHFRKEWSLSECELDNIKVELTQANKTIKSAIRQSNGLYEAVESYELDDEEFSDNLLLDIKQVLDILKSTDPDTNTENKEKL